MNKEDKSVPITTRKGSGTCLGLKPTSIAIAKGSKKGTQGVRRNPGGKPRRQGLLKTNQWDIRDYGHPRTKTMKPGNSQGNTELDDPGISIYEVYKISDNHNTHTSLAKS